MTLKKFLPYVVFSSVSMDAATIGHWRFEEGTDGVAASGVNSVIDSSTQMDHGTPIGDPTYSSAVAVNPIPNGGASNTLSLNFDGTGDTVTASPTVSLASNAAFTVEFWMRRRRFRDGSCFTGGSVAWLHGLDRLGFSGKTQ